MGGWNVPNRQRVSFAFHLPMCCGPLSVLASELPQRHEARAPEKGRSRSRTSADEINLNSVLVPPAPCSNTIRPHAELSALDTALNRSGLYPTLDHAPNVTCLAPNTKAFAAAGDPQNSLAQEALSTALLFHTLPMPLYTNFLVDGQELTSLANLTVKISVNSSGTYFNDARVLEQNVL